MIREFLIITKEFCTWNYLIKKCYWKPQLIKTPRNGVSQSLWTKDWLLWHYLQDPECFDSLALGHLDEASGKHHLLVCGWDNILIIFSLFILEWAWDAVEVLNGCFGGCWDLDATKQVKTEPKQAISDEVSLLSPMITFDLCIIFGVKGKEGREKRRIHRICKILS